MSKTRITQLSSLIQSDLFRPNSRTWLSLISQKMQNVFISSEKFSHKNKDNNLIQPLSSKRNMHIFKIYNLFFILKSHFFFKEGKEVRWIKKIKLYLRKLYFWLSSFSITKRVWRWDHIKIQFYFYTVYELFNNDLLEKRKTLSEQILKNFTFIEISHSPEKWVRIAKYITVFDCNLLSFSVILKSFNFKKKSIAEDKLAKINKFVINKKIPKKSS